MLFFVVASAIVLVELALATMSMMPVVFCLGVIYLKKRGKISDGKSHSGIGYEFASNVALRQRLT